MEKIYGFKSASSVQVYIKRLEQKGFLKRNGKNIEILKNSKGRIFRKKEDREEEINDTRNNIKEDEILVPVIENISNDEDILNNKNIVKSYKIPKDLVLENFDFNLNNKYFFYKNSGNSMIEGGILDGDFILFKLEDNPKNGEIILAKAEEKIVVKVYQKEEKYIKLEPQNHLLDPILVNEEDLKIYGKMVRTL